MYYDEKTNRDIEKSKTLKIAPAFNKVDAYISYAVRYRYLDRYVDR